MDDTSPELIGIDFQKDLLDIGAIDFYFIPVQMKKGRPGLKLSVLLHISNLENISNYILENSTSIGVRYYPVERIILKRKKLKINTPYGPVRIKQVITPGGIKRNKIEYESLQNLKETHNISILRLQEELYPLIANTKDHEEE